MHFHCFFMACLVLVLLIQPYHASAQVEEKPCPAEPSDSGDSSNPEREKGIFLGRGITVQPNFDCRLAEIDGWIAAPMSLDGWRQNQPWLAEQLAHVKSLGRFVEHDADGASLFALTSFNGISYRLDKYENAYLQYSVQYYQDESEPTVSKFVVYFPHQVTGIVRETTLPNPVTEVRDEKTGEVIIKLEQRFFLVAILQENWSFIVSEDEFRRLKEGERATFQGFGPIPKPIF